jgi:hypothetical protein
VELSGADQQSIRRMQQDYAQWLLDTHGSRFGTTQDLAAELQALGDSRRDLLTRRGERHHDRDLRFLEPEDVQHLREQAWLLAEDEGLDRVGRLAVTAHGWRTYLGFLAAAGRWEGTAADLQRVRELLTVAPRTGLLGRGAHTLQNSRPVELPALQRTALVRTAEDVLRGRASGGPALTASLVALGYRTAAGRRGPRWSSWDSPRAAEAGAARRRLVVAAVRESVRADPGAGFALAMTTSSVPTEVALGGRVLADVVAAGRLPDLVAGGVLPDRAPWRIVRGLQLSVHVGLTRLSDDGALPWAVSGAPEGEPGRDQGRDPGDELARAS